MTYNTYLSYVNSMQLAHNQLVGKILADVTKLVKMTYLDFSWNSFTGNIPANIGGMTLTSLHLSNNHLSGEIPQSLAMNARLQTPALANNTCLVKFPQAPSYSPRISVPIILAMKVFVALLFRCALSGFS